MACTAVTAMQPKTDVNSLTSADLHATSTAPVSTASEDSNASNLSGHCQVAVLVSDTVWVC